MSLVRTNVVYRRKLLRFVAQNLFIAWYTVLAIEPSQLYEPWNKFAESVPFNMGQTRTSFYIFVLMSIQSQIWYKNWLYEKRIFLQTK